MNRYDLEFWKKSPPRRQSLFWFQFSACVALNTSAVIVNLRRRGVGKNINCYMSGVLSLDYVIKTHSSAYNIRETDIK